jgi:hypothetical protein
MKYLEPYNIFENLRREEAFENKFKIDILPNIEKYCSKYLDILSEMKNTEDDNKLNENDILYRGMDSSKKLKDVGVLKMKVRKDRKPMSTRKITHDILSDYSMKLYNWDMRSEGVFATAYKNEASMYGHTFIFLPIGDYEFLYNENVEDLTRYLALYDIDYKPEPSDKDFPLGDRKVRSEEEIIERVKETMEGYTDKDLIHGMRQKVEISFKCDEYYIIHNRYIYLFLQYINNR